MLLVSDTRRAQPIVVILDSPFARVLSSFLNTHGHARGQSLTMCGRSRSSKAVRYQSKTRRAYATIPISRQ